MGRRGAMSTSRFCCSSTCSSTARRRCTPGMFGLASAASSVVQHLQLVSEVYDCRCHGLSCSLWFVMERSAMVIAVSVTLFRSVGARTEGRYLGHAFSGVINYYCAAGGTGAVQQRGSDREAGELPVQRQERQGLRRERAAPRQAAGGAHHRPRSHPRGTPQGMAQPSLFPLYLACRMHLDLCMLQILLLCAVLQRLSR